MFARESACLVTLGSACLVTLGSACLVTLGSAYPGLFRPKKTRVRLFGGQKKTRVRLFGGPKFRERGFWNLPPVGGYLAINVIRYVKHVLAYDHKNKSTNKSGTIRR